MPGFTGYDDFIAETTQAGKVLEWAFLRIAPTVSQGAGSWLTLWKATGSPGAGADPATTPGTARNDAVGSINFAAVSTDQKFLVVLEVSSTQAGTIMLCDRLVDVSGISLTTTGNKTVNSTTLPRYAGTAATPVQAWLEITTATTVTAPVVNLSAYTAADGTTGNVGASVTFPAAATVLNTAIRLPEAAGKVGVRSVEVGLNVGTAATAGAATLVLLKELATIPVVANQNNKISLMFDFPPMQRVFDTASLFMMFQGQAAVTPTVQGKVQLAYG